jgi:hypothetical protein
LSLRGTKNIPSLVIARNEVTKQSHKKVEIAALPSVARNDNLLFEIATLRSQRWIAPLPSVARNDNLLFEIATLRSQRWIAALPSVARNDNLLFEIATPFQGSQ